MPRVSVIMVTGGNRIIAFENVLKSWSKITHPDYDFTLIYSGEESEFAPIKILVDSYPFITRFEKSDLGESTFATTTRIWRKEGMKSAGDYIVFAMADEILRDYDILEQMENTPKDRRTSINTYFLNPTQTLALRGIGWESSPMLIEDLPDFWSNTEFEGFDNNSRRTNGEIVCHINGATREYWEWLGWHRDDVLGYLNLDQDIITREICLGKPMAITMSACYHQWHGAGNAYVPDSHRLSPYRYETHEQARLLAPVDRWKPEDMWMAK